MNWPTEEELISNIVRQTAEFRYRICWAGGRRLVASQGIDPMGCLQLACDPGDDVAGTLVLPDGAIIDFDMKEDPATRELVSISRWQVAQWTDRESELARRIVGDRDTSSFDRLVSDFYQTHWKDRDHPLPAKI